MKYKIIDLINKKTVDPVELVHDMIKKGKIHALSLLFNDEFADLKIVPDSTYIKDFKDETKENEKSK